MDCKYCKNTKKCLGCSGTGICACSVEDKNKCDECYGTGVCQYCEEKEGEE